MWSFIDTLVACIARPSAQNTVGIVSLAANAYCRRISIVLVGMHTHITTLALLDPNLGSVTGTVGIRHQCNELTSKKICNLAVVEEKNL